MEDMSAVVLAMAMADGSGGGGGGGDTPVQVPGTTVSIEAQAGKRYVCTGAYVSSLSFTPSTSGFCSVRFVAGSNMVLSLPNTVKMPDWWSASSIVSWYTYEISIEDGVYGVVTSWA